MHGQQNIKKKVFKKVFWMV